VDEEDFVAEDDDALAARACRKDGNSGEYAELRMRRGPHA
jgi:hypothetical protein